MKIILFLLLLFCSWAAPAQTLNIMSYNIHHGADKDEVMRLSELAGFIRQSGADIIGLQEVDSVCKRSGMVNQARFLAEQTGMHYAFVRHYAYDGGAYGQAILSKYPLREIKNLRLSLLKKDGTRDTRAMIAATIKVNNRDFLFASAHFALDTASRLLQADETLSYFADAKMPVIFTGDLNAEPQSQEIRKLNGWFFDTDRKTGLTYPVLKPLKKIDYIYVSKKHNPAVIEHRVLTGVLWSDHLPVVARVEWKR